MQLYCEKALIYNSYFFNPAPRVQVLRKTLPIINVSINIAKVEHSRYKNTNKRKTSRISVYYLTNNICDSTLRFFWVLQILVFIFNENLCAYVKQSYLRVAKNLNIEFYGLGGVTIVKILSHCFGRLPVTSRPVSDRKKNKRILQQLGVKQHGRRSVVVGCTWFFLSISFWSYEIYKHDKTRRARNAFDV